METPRIWSGKKVLAFVAGMFVVTAGLIYAGWNPGKHPAGSAATPPSPASDAGPSATPARDDQSDPIVYITRTGKKYHRAGCSSLRASSIERHLSEVQGRYGPCSKCNPPR